MYTQYVTDATQITHSNQALGTGQFSQAAKDVCAVKTPTDTFYFSNVLFGLKTLENTRGANKYFYF